jgi:hypothetical protein
MVETMVGMKVEVRVGLSAETKAERMVAQMAEQMVGRLVVTMGWWRAAMMVAQTAVSWAPS